MLYSSGNEYDEIEPVWDWYRLPGTTSERAASGVGGKYDLKPGNKRSSKAIAGGASDGMVGTHANQFSLYNVTANKSWFFFDRGEVAMGNSIRQTKPTIADDVVGTNITQTLLNGNVIYSTVGSQSTTLSDGQSATPKGLRWVNHNSVGYFFPEPVDNATIRNLTHTGAWHEINLVVDPSEKVTTKLFDLDISHGQTPTDANYVYAIIPGIAASEMDAFLAAKPFTILRNDAVVQAVIDNAMGITEANFYTTGEVTIREGTKLKLTDPNTSASLILRTNDNKLIISVASPEHRPGPVTLQLTGHYAGENAQWNTATGTTAFLFTLPDGATAGGTVTQTFTTVP